MPESHQLEAGVWGVLPTPFSSDLSVDYASIESAVSYYREEGSTGLVALGVFGEAGRLSPQEQRRVLEVVGTAAGDTPVACGVSAVDLTAATEQAAMYSSALPSLHAVMVKVPSPDPVTTADHLRSVARAAGAGVVVQDYPVDTGVTITSEALAEAIERCDVAVAVKAEAPPTAISITRILSRVDVPAFGGLGGAGLLDELAAGSAGAMTGFSHPAGVWAAVRAYRSGGFAEASRAYAPWLPLANFEGQPGIGLAIRKETLCRRGVIRCASVRPPGTALPEEARAHLALHLALVPSTMVT